MNIITEINMLIHIILILTLLIESNSQIDCQYGAISNTLTTDRGPFRISSVLCSDDDMMYLDMEYLNYDDNWWGIVFSYDMAGYSLCYTVGQNSNSDPNRQVGLYQYTLTNTDRSATYNPSHDWIYVSDTTSGGTIRVVYKQPLSTLPYSLLTTTIPINYAWGTGMGLVLGDHDKSGGESKNTEYLTFTTVTRQPTIKPVIAPTSSSPTQSPTPTTTNVPTQSPIDICPQGASDGSVNIANKLQITATLCPSDNMIYFDIMYSSYNNNWFGLVFDSNDMYGSSLIYTTGKSGRGAIYINEGLHAYNITNKALSRYESVVYSPQYNWEEVFTSKTNGIRIVYKKVLSDTPWNILTQSIKIGYAIGNSLVLETHTERNDINAAYILSFTNETPTPTTGTTTTQSGTHSGKGCEKQNLVETTATLDEFTVTLYINCDTNTVDVTIAYSEYNKNWFAIVFSDTMVGNALIYTTGKSNELTRVAGLYSYTNEGYTSNKVSYDGPASDWANMSETLENGVFTVYYQQHLNKTEAFSLETEEVYFKWAKGTNSLILSQHVSDASGRAQQSQKMNLLSGETTIVKDDLTLEVTHGVLMWLAWAVFASIGIMSSAFRHLFPDGPIWFYIHQTVQICVVSLDIIAFMIALVFVERNGKTHFSNSHMIIGLVVTILCVLQPLNALFRAHPPANGWPKGVKPTKRVVWEWIHKGCGYVAWILGCVAVMLGLLLIGEDTLAYVHMFLWCGLLFIIYIILFVIKISKAKKESQVESVNSHEQDKISKDGHESEDPMLDTDTHKPNGD